MLIECVTGVCYRVCQYCVLIGCVMDTFPADEKEDHGADDHLKRGSRGRKGMEMINEVWR